MVTSGFAAPELNLKAGSIIKHKKFIDVAFLVTNVDGDEISGQWINLGQVSSYLIEKRQTLIIPESKRSEWQTCVNPEFEHLRCAEWR